MTDLVANPLWQPADVGLPLPASPHATSVCLPTWRANLAYEEGDEEIVAKLQTGYPRFVLNQFVKDLLAREVPADKTGIILGSRAAADHCRAYSTQFCELRKLRADVWLLIGPPAAADAFKRYWQHTGEGISSRTAEEILAGQPAPDAVAAELTLRERITAPFGITPGHTRLYPTGMTAVTAAWRIAHKLTGRHRTVQFGFPYVDSLKLQEEFGHCTFYPRGDAAELEKLRILLADRDVAAVFCEFPANPLLESPDLAALAAACRDSGTLLVVDDTIATSINVDVGIYADLITTSLTKTFSGVGDVMAGAATVSSHSLQRAALLRALAADDGPGLAPADALVLEANSRDYPDRVRRMNQTASALAANLHAHPAVAEVRYPEWTSRTQFDDCRRPDGGFGTVISITLADPAATTPAFFDRLRVSKGPSLGTNFSLVCPYVILAHYHELPRVEACGVSRWLIRISVGLEDPDDLVARFREALPR